MVKCITLIIFFIFYHFVYLEYVEVEHVLDIMASYSGRNAIILHMSVYILIVQLMSIKHIKQLNSETVIRFGREQFINHIIYHFILESFIFLSVFYLISSLFVIGYLGSGYFIQNKVYLPIILSLLTWIEVYLILLVLFSFIYITTNKTSIAIIVTEVVSILSTFVFRQLLSNITYFEMIYLYGMNVFKCIQVFIILTMILIILVNLLYIYFEKRDLIYEDEI